MRYRSGGMYFNQERDHDLIDAIREMLGLEPIYAEEAGGKRALAKRQSPSSNSREFERHFIKPNGQTPKHLHR